jgi:hypothetical protein
MGWLFGWDTRKKLVEHLLAQNGGNYKAIKSCSVGNNLWVVFEAKEAAQSPERFVCLFLIKGPPFGRQDSYGWGYKDVDESMGPYEINCPASYLDLAQPEPTKGHAVEWRTRVRERAAKLKAAVPGARFINPHKAELPVYEVTKRRSPSSWLIKDTADGHRYRAGPKFISSLELLT